MEEFSHYSDKGLPEMVDISGKDDTDRMARASGFIRIKGKTIDLIENKLLPKGNLFEIAKIAGIMGAKKTSELIPLCHPLFLTHIDIHIRINREKGGLELLSEVKLNGKTGVEMEALTAITVAALTIYDMCKAVDKTIIIEDIKLIEKMGGKSGHFIDKE